MVSTPYFRRKLDSWCFHLQHHTGPKQEGAQQKGITKQGQSLLRSQALNRRHVLKGLIREGTLANNF